MKGNLKKILLTLTLALCLGGTLLVNATNDCVNGQNPANPNDVNRDGRVGTSDVIDLLRQQQGLLSGMCGNVNGEGGAEEKTSDIIDLVRHLRTLPEPEPSSPPVVTASSNVSGSQATITVNVSPEFIAAVPVVPPRPGFHFRVVVDNNALTTRAQILFQDVGDDLLYDFAVLNLGNGTTEDLVNPLKVGGKNDLKKGVDLIVRSDGFLQYTENRTNTPSGGLLRVHVRTRNSAGDSSAINTKECRGLSCWNP